MIARASRRLLVGAMIGVTFILYWWWSGGERRTLSRMLSPERGALFREEFEAFRLLCEAGMDSEGLRARCQDRARFVLRFPECDSSCRRVVALVLPPATR